MTGRHRRSLLVSVRYAAPERYFSSENHCLTPSGSSLRFHICLLLFDHCFYNIIFYIVPSNSKVVNGFYKKPSVRCHGIIQYSAAQVRLFDGIGFGKFFSGSGQNDAA